MKTKLLFLLALGLGSTAVAVGEPRIVKGQVLSDSDGEPMIGVAISEKGTTNGTITDADGNFSINVEDGAVLTISYMGYTTQNVKPVGNSPIKIELVEDLKTLDDVVVVGYGTMKKSDLAGSVVSVDREAMMRRTPTNIGQALQGAAAGVIVVAQDGAPDANAQIRIRGIGTINGEAKPLYVIDGIPSGHEANYLNPADIESIEVLKDASAAAIYGSDGANGVIMITTKHGEKGKTNISVTADFGFQTMPYEIDTLGINEYAAAVRTSKANDGNGLSNQIWDAKYDGKRNNINWQDQMTRMGFKQQYGISASGGNEKTQYNASVGYLDNQGLIVNSFYKRLNARVNVKSKVNKYLDFGVDMSYYRSQSRGSNRGLGNNGNLSSHRDLAQMAPTLDYIDPTTQKLVNVNVVNPDGTYGSGWNNTSDGWEGNTAIYQNVYATQKELTGTAYNHNVTINPYVELTLLDLDEHKFNVRAQGSYGHSSYESKSWTDLYHRYNFINGVRTEDLYKGNRYNELNLSQNASTYLRMSTYMTYTWKTDFNNLTFMLGNEVSKSDGSWVSAGANTFISQDLRQTKFATNEVSKTGQGGYNNETHTISYFGRLSYSLMDRYLLTATFRKDGSSNFSEKNRWGTFPSFAAGWRISEEDFMKDFDMITNLKLRAGWGQTGNAGGVSGKWRYRLSQDNVWYQFYPEDASLGQYSNRDKVAGYYAPLVDRGLKWETNEQTNVGIDLGLNLFDGDLTVAFDYYNRQTKDLLLNRQIRPSSGDTQVYTNYGTIENKGVEFSVSYHKQLNKDWGITATVNGTTLKNKVKKMGLPIYAEASGGNDGSTNDGSNVLGVAASAFSWQNHSLTEEGGAIGSYWGWLTDGIFQSDEDANAYVNAKGEKIQGKAKAGDYKFKDVNGDGVLDDKDRVILGNGVPKFTFGINLSATYKNFDMAIYMNGILGQDLLSYSAMRLSCMCQGDEQTTVNILKDSYGKVARVENGKVVNSGASLPRLSYLDENKNGRVSDAWVKNGNFLRINTLQIGYTVPRKLIRPLGVNNIRAYASIQNLALFSPYKKYGDPECGQGNVLFTGLDTGRYPTPRTYMLGVNVTF